MTNSDYTYIAAVVDRSGSMEAIRSGSEEGLNAFIGGQKEEPGNCDLMLVEFDTVPEYKPASNPYTSRRIANGFSGQYVPEIKTVYDGDIKGFKSYKLKPRGGTPLYDAVGYTIVNLGEKLSNMDESDRPGTVIVVVQTDGDENSSEEYTAEAIKSLISKQTDQFGWAFIFLGANQDAMLAGGRMGFASHSTISYSATDHNTRAVYDSVSLAATGLRAGTYEGFTDDQRSEAL